MTSLKQQTIENWEDWPLIVDGLFIYKDQYGYYYLEDATGHMLISTKQPKEICKEIKYHKVSKV